jgi:tetratricopeptide (TPR) repeat protein
MRTVQKFFSASVIAIAVLVFACCGGDVLQAALVPQAAVAAQNSAAANDKRIGSKVIITKSGAQLKTPAATVWTAWMGDVYTVSLANGEWLWIAEKGGWLWEKETIPFDTAIASLSARISRAPTAETLHLRGAAYFAHEQYDAAIADLTASLKLNAKNPMAFNSRGKARMVKKDFQGAVADFSEAIRLDPRVALFLHNRALAWIEITNYPKALTDLQSALLENPNFAEALNNRGIVYQKMQRNDDAIKDFDAALKINPAYVDALGNRAYAWKKKGEFAKAIADLEEAIRISPVMYEASNDLAWLLATCSSAEFRNPVRALELAKSACTLSEYKDWNALDTLAAALAANEQFEEAGKWSATAVENAPESEKERLKGHLARIVKREVIVE